MQELQAIKQALADRNITAVAAATGLNAHTIYRLAQGKVKPHKGTMRILQAYFDAQQKPQTTETNNALPHQAN